MAGHVRSVAPRGVLRARRCRHRGLHVLRREQGKAGLPLTFGVHYLPSPIPTITCTKLHGRGALPCTADSHSIRILAAAMRDKVQNMADINMSAEPVNEGANAN